MARPEPEGKYLIDRETHPGYFESSWPVFGRIDQLLGQRESHRLPHILPQSVLVAPIGNLWVEHGHHRLWDMVVHAEKAGLAVAVQEMEEMSVFAHGGLSEAIGHMRSSAASMALDSGVEWVLMVDNDVLLEEDTLERLLAWDRPVVFPMLHVLEDKYPWGKLSTPDLEAHTGLRPVLWQAASCMLFNVRVFNGINVTMWYGADYQLAQQLNHIGHRIYVDTDTIVDVTRGPSRPQVLPWAEYWATMERNHRRMREEDRDRRPPPGYDPVFANGTVTDSGAYMPLGSFLQRRKMRNASPH